MAYWLVKSEPDEYGYADLSREKVGSWTGVRNYQARNNLRAMQVGDQVLFYHSRQGLEIVGLAEVVREAYPDPTAEKGDWSAVDLRAIRPFPHTISLATIKAHAELQNMVLAKNSRLSVMPVEEDHFRLVLEMGER